MARPESAGCIIKQVIASVLHVHSKTNKTFSFFYTHILCKCQNKAYRTGILVNGYIYKWLNIVTSESTNIVQNPCTLCRIHEYCIGNLLFTFNLQYQALAHVCPLILFTRQYCGM